jgi:hypothetical protein
MNIFGHDISCAAEFRKMSGFSAVHFVHASRPDLHVLGEAQN